MGRIFDLLKASVGQKSLHDPIGKWRQAVSLAIDGDQVGTGTAIIQVVRTTDSAALVASAATAVVFPTPRVAENVAVAPTPIGDNEMSYDPATGFFVLTPGLYDLEAHLVLNTFATPATDHAIYHWALSAALAVPLVLNAVSDVYPGASTVNVSSAPVNRAIVRVAAGANISVALSVTALVGATTEVQGSVTAPPVLASAYAIVRKLS